MIWFWLVFIYRLISIFKRIIYFYLNILYNRLALLLYIRIIYFKVYLETYMYTLLVFIINFLNLTNSKSVKVVLIFNYSYYGSLLIYQFMNVTIGSYFWRLLRCIYNYISVWKINILCVQSWYTFINRISFKK